MESLHWSGLDSVWIGLSDIGREGRYLWVSNEIADHDNVDWLRRQPNGGDCVHMDFDYDWQALDDECSRSRYVLCEWTTFTC